MASDRDHDRDRDPYSTADDDGLSIEPTTPWEKLELESESALVGPDGSMELSESAASTLKGMPGARRLRDALNPAPPGPGDTRPDEVTPMARHYGADEPRDDPGDAPPTPVVSPPPIPGRSASASRSTSDERAASAVSDEMSTVAGDAGPDPGAPSSNEAPQLYAPHLEPADPPRAGDSLVETVTGAPAESARIGPFQVLRRLGAGGMGVVVSAYDERLDRRVALKLLRRHARKNVRTAGRIKREAQALAKLSHTNVVPVFEVGEWDGQIYVAMEHVEGVTLKEWQPAAAGWRDVLAMHLQAARGLAAAHFAGLVHRDYKPANVLVGDDGRARVLDFGLVRARTDDDEMTRSGEITSSGRYQPAGSSEHSALNRDLTLAGAVMGTPAYMSPEQRLGKPVDARSDQYSFCVALFEGLCGVHPFEGDSPEHQFHKMMDEEISAVPRGLDLPREVLDAIARGLRREQAARWPSMEALIGVLERALTRDHVSDPAIGKQYRLVAFAVLATVTLAILVGLFIPSIRDQYIYTRQAAIVVAGGGLLLVLAIVALGRDSLLRSQLNRRLFWWLSLTVFGMLLTRLAGWTLETSLDRLFIKEQALILTSTAMAGVLVDRWAWWIAGVWAIGLGTSLALVPGYAAEVSTAAVLLSCLLAAFLWGPTSADAR